jgi:AcrR family transcriptional regulator
MSRARIRPTREETRRRLVDAAAAVFAEHGIAGASVEQITEAAGFTRGAFYSNFATKEELAIAMLAEHLAVGQVHNRQIAERRAGGRDLVDAFRHDVGRHDPLHRDPLLQVELMLYVGRTPELRPLLGEHLRAMRQLVGDITLAALRADGVAVDVDAEQVGTIVVAIEDGLRMHRLIDPDSTDADAFFDALDLLHRLVVAPLARADRPGPRPEREEARA